MENRRVSIQPPQPVQVDIALEQDYKLGMLIADAKLTATQQAYDDRYSEGVASFFKAEITPEDDRLMGKMAASIALEERRKTLVEVAIRSAAYSVVSGVTALLVGFSPVQSVVCLPVSVVISICTGKKQNDRINNASRVCDGDDFGIASNSTKEGIDRADSLEGESPVQGE